MHRAARLVRDGLGHEGGKAVMPQRSLTDQTLEEEHIIGQPHRIAMGEVQFDLPRAGLLQDAVNLKALRFGKVINVVDHLAVFVDGRQRIGLLGGGPATRAAHRRLDRHVGVKVARGQEELHFRRDHRGPALIVIQLHNALQHVARGKADRVALLIHRVMDHLQGHIRRPGRGGGGGAVRHQDHVRFGEGIERVVRPLAGNGLQEDRVWQEVVALLGEFRRWHRLAARNPGDVADYAFHLVHPASADVFARRFGQLVGPFGHEITLLV